jgi:hypothetical protein
MANMDAIGYGEWDPILPDGWKEGDDLLAANDETNAAPETDGSETAAEESAENATDVTSGEEATPTTDSDESDSTSTEESETDTESDGAPEAETAPSKRILKLKVNHQEKEVDVNGLTDEELIEKLQKADAFDAMKNDQLKQKFREAYNEQIDAGLTEAASRMVASYVVGGKEFPLTDEEESGEPFSEETEKSGAKENREADFSEQLKQLKALDPDVKEIPQEVLDAYMRGANLTNAYALYKVAQSTKAAEKIKHENQVLKQNAAAAAKAPVKGVSNTGVGTKTKEDDPFLKGFNADNW